MESPTILTKRRSGWVDGRVGITMVADVQERVVAAATAADDDDDESS